MRKFATIDEIFVFFRLRHLKVSFFSKNLKRSCYFGNSGKLGGFFRGKSARSAEKIRGFLLGDFRKLSFEKLGDFRNLKPLGILRSRMYSIWAALIMMQDDLRYSMMSIQNNVPASWFAALACEFFPLSMPNQQSYHKDSQFNRESNCETLRGMDDCHLHIALV